MGNNNVVGFFCLFFILRTMCLISHHVNLGDQMDLAALLYSLKRVWG